MTHNLEPRRLLFLYQSHSARIKKTEKVEFRVYPEIDISVDAEIYHSAGGFPNSYRIVALDPNTATNRQPMLG